MIARYGVSFISGCAVTFSLLWVMQILIASGMDALTDKKDFKFLDFVRVKETEQLFTETAKPKKPPEPEQQPPDMPPPQADSSSSATGASFGVPAITGVDINIGIGGFAVTDGEYLPIVRVEPIYPRRAQSRGLNGSCIMTFTVNKLGLVSDPTAECTSTVFERTSLNAVAKWKFKPRVVDGEAIDSPGVQTLLTYELAED